MKGEVKGADELRIKWLRLLRKGVKKQQHPNTTFKKLLKSVDKGCIMALERRARKTFSWSPQAELFILR